MVKKKDARKTDTVIIEQYIDNPDGRYAVCTTSSGKPLIIKIGGNLCIPPPAETQGRQVLVMYQTYAYNAAHHRTPTPELVSWEYWIDHDGNPARITSKGRPARTLKIAESERVV